MGLIDTLLVKLFEPWSAEKHNGVVKLAQGNTIISGPGVRQRRTPFGTHISFEADNGGSFSSSFFRATVRKSQGVWQVRFATGFIGGVKPTIEGQPIDRKGADGKYPALVVNESDFDPDEGIVGIYFRVEVDNDFAIVKVEPIATAVKPRKEPWIAHKL